MSSTVHESISKKYLCTTIDYPYFIFTPKTGKQLCTRCISFTAKFKRHIDAPFGDERWNKRGKFKLLYSLYSCATRSRFRRLLTRAFKFLHCQTGSRLADRWTVEQNCTDVATARIRVNWPGGVREAAPSARRCGVGDGGSAALADADQRTALLRWPSHRLAWPDSVWSLSEMSLSPLADSQSEPSRARESRWPH